MRYVRDVSVVFQFDLCTLLVFIFVFSYYSELKRLLYRVAH